MRWARLAGLLAVIALVAAAGARSEQSGHPRTHTPVHRYAIPRGIHKIRHVVIIMQENRSFDNYFGTYPGAKGIPGLAGHRGTVPCLPDPGERCVHLWHDRRDLNQGGLYSYANVLPEVDGGRMDGFIKEQEKIFPKRGHDDVAGYHTGADVPNYWAYARH